MKDHYWKLLMLKKLIKHRILIFTTLISTIKYSVYHWLLSDEKLVRLVSNNLDFYPTEIDDQVQPYKHILRLTNRIINRIKPEASCLVRSLVKKDVLNRFGISTYVCFGLMKENDRFIAHSWLAVENSGGFSKVFQAI